MKVESITPYNDNRTKSEQVEEMFDSISGNYDFLNRAMTLGIDKIWRKRTIKALQSSFRCGGKIIDLATGTGDMALAIARALPEAEIYGVDISEGMLTIAREKARATNLAERVCFLKGDGTNLPFDEATADALTISFGIRNFEDLLDGYREMHRVLSPGGKVYVLELSSPTATVPAFLFKLYTRYCIPILGKMFSRDKRAYTYLPESVAVVPQGKEMTSLMSKAGFIDCRASTYTFGACTLYTGRKPL